MSVIQAKLMRTAATHFCIEVVFVYV